MEYGSDLSTSIAFQSSNHMAAIPPLEILDRVERRLAVCGRHLANAQILPGQQRELLSAAVVSLKSIWNILNNMDKSDPRIATWFKAVSDTSKNDPLLRFFKSVRDMDMKEGVDGIRGMCVHARPGASVSAGPDGFTFRWSTPEVGAQQVLVASPPNVVGKFMGDPEGGGMGFDVRSPDGTLVKQYITVPSVCAQVSVFYPAAPLEHLCERLTTDEADVLVALYLAFWKDSCEELGCLVQHE